MSHPRYSSEEIVRLGRKRYDRELRSKVELQHRGEFLALNIETGEYVIDRSDITAIRRAKAERPDAALYLVRIGSPSAYKLGGCIKKEVEIQPL